MPNHYPLSNEDRAADRNDGMPFAVVTGASSGIGLELAKEFARHGFDLLITAESSRIEDAANELRSFGPRISTFHADLATSEGVQALWTRIQEESQPLDAIALNAGVGVGGPFVENTFDDELNLVNLNIISVVHLAKLVLRDMVTRNEGRVLITASLAAETPAPFQAVYGASKAFVLSFAEAVRNELRDTNVVVTALQPGATDTNFFRRADMQGTKVGASKKRDPADVAREGFAALMKGQDRVVSAMGREKIQAALGHVMQETARAQSQRKQNQRVAGA